MFGRNVYVLIAVLILQIYVVYNQGEDPEAIKDFNFSLEIEKKCKCVSYLQCDENGTIIINGESLIEDRIERPRPICKGGKFKGSMVCCKLPGPIEPRGPITHDVKRRKCGLQGPVISGRVLSIDEEQSITVDGEFPWMVAVYVKKPPEENYKYRCSGSLIHPRVVLTTEHNIRRIKTNSIKVIANGRAALSAVGKQPAQERNVKEIVHHLDYFEPGYRYDIALLIMDEPINITKSVNAVCLPPQPVDLVGKRCVIAGWGINAKNTSSKVLNKVELPFVPHEKCQEKMREEMEFEFDLDTSFMCAGGEEGIDACKGDGGAPLVCPFPNSRRFYQIGIVSWGLGCGLQGVPGVYTDVSVMQTWIRKELDKRNITITDSN